MRESVGNGAMTKVVSSSCELLTKHTRDSIVNAMSKDRRLAPCLPDGTAILMLRRTDENPEHAWIRLCTTWGLSLLCIVGLFLGGCVVPKGKYEAAVTDMVVAKTDLKKSRMQSEALEQENERLRADHKKAALDLEMLSAEIQEIKEGQESERDLLSTREVQLQRDREAMVSKLQEIQHVHQQLKSQNRTLRDAVRRYEKEIKAAREANVKSAASASMTTKKSAAKAPPMVAKKSSPKPAPPPVAVPFNGTATPVNINTASANDLVLFLGLTKEVADRVVSNRPYRLRGELVSKQVVARATFAVIKDRITAAPQ